MTRGDYSRFEDELAAIHRIVGGRPAHQAADALLSRLDGLAAARHGRLTLAEQHLRRARDGYAAREDNGAITVVDDLRALIARRGTAAPAQSVRVPDHSPQARLTRSEELRLIGRYEEALNEIDPVLQGPLDPAVRYFFLEAKVRLLRLLRIDDEADDLMPELYEAARASAQPEENRLAAQRLDPANAGLGAPATRAIRLGEDRCGGGSSGRAIRPGRLPGSSDENVSDPRAGWPPRIVPAVLLLQPGGRSAVIRRGVSGLVGWRRRRSGWPVRRRWSRSRSVRRVALWTRPG